MIKGTGAATLTASLATTPPVKGTFVALGSNLCQQLGLAGRLSVQPFQPVDMPSMQFSIPVLDGKYIIHEDSNLPLDDFLYRP